MAQATADFTPARDDELGAAGEFPNQHPGGEMASAAGLGIRYR